MCRRSEGTTVGLHVSRVLIKNFRNFADVDVVLQPTSVLVGENKAGKSNFLFALRLVLDNTLPDSARILRPEDFYDGLSDPIGEIIEVSIELSGFESNIGAKAILQKYLISTKPATAKLTYQFRPQQNLKGAPPQSLHDYEAVLFGGLKQVALDFQLRNYIQFIVLPALRDAESELSNWRRSPIRRLLEDLSLNPKRVGKIAKSLDQVSKRLLKIPAVGTLASQIQIRTDEMVGRIHGTETQLALASSDPKQLLRSVKLLIDGAKGRQISDASLGTANVLFLALLMQETETKLEQKQLVSLILGIEEPEAHLHPHMQRVLFRYFLQRRHSVLVSTHSAHIASVSPVKSLVSLTKEGNAGTKAYASSQLKLSEWEEHDLQRYFDVTKAEMPFAKGVILVEGIAEQFLIPAFASNLRLNGSSLELDRLGISVSAVYGTDFLPYVKLLGPDGLSIPFVLISDGDATTSNGDLIYAGIQRVLQLLPDTQKQEADALLSKDEIKAVQKLLRNHGFFVSTSTLEIEVALKYPNKTKKAFAELVSEKRAEKFAKLVDAVTATEELDEVALDAFSQMLNRIERLGKGRFAQRLANKVQGRPGPKYIADAIAQISQKVLKRSGLAP